MSEVESGFSQTCKMELSSENQPKGFIYFCENSRTRYSAVFNVSTILVYIHHIPHPPPPPQKKKEKLARFYRKILSHLRLHQLQVLLDFEKRSLSQASFTELA